MVEAHKAGRTLARNGETRTYVNDVARTLPVEEADALLAGYYAELRRLKGAPVEDRVNARMRALASALAAKVRT
jgi:hypothetical protein